MKKKPRTNTMHTLVGKGLSPGLTQGTAFVYRDVLQRDSELYVIDPAQIENEKARIVDAIADVRQSLILDAQRMEARLGRQSADIFRAQEEILLDSSVVEELKRTVEVERINAEQVVRTVCKAVIRHNPNAVEPRTPRF
jgi:phosphotransferase system enzyme I (PtsI)